jgi:hypothetical protein
MPEEQGVYRIVNGKRYVFPDEEKAKAYDAARLSIMQQRADQEGLLSQAVIGAKSILPGVIRGTGLAATGIGSVFDLEAARKAGEYLEEKAKQTSESLMEPYQRYTTGAMLGETAGGIIPGIAATALAAAAAPETGGASLALIPAAVGGLFGAAQGAGEVGSDIREARARGVQVSPEQERNLALIQGGITGILEGGIAGKVGKGIRGIATAGRLAAEPETAAITELLKGGYSGALRRGAGLAAAEGLSEGAQQLSQNVLARGDVSALGPGYDPQRELLAGVPESVLVGGLFGGVLGGGIELFKQNKLQKGLEKQREIREQSAEVERQIEDALVSREIQGQQQEEIVQGLLAEKEQARLDEEAKNEAKRLDASLTNAVGILKNEKATVDQKQEAYQEIAAQELFSQTFADLTGNKKYEANRKATELFRENADPESRALYIQMKERAEQEAALPSGVAGPVQEPSDFIPSKEIEIKRLADEIKKAGDLPEGSRVTLPTPFDEVTIPAAPKVEATASGEERIPGFQEKYSSQIYQMPYAKLTEDQQNVVDKIVERQTQYSVVQPKIQAKQQAAELKKQREGIVGLVDLVARQRQQEQALQEEEFNKELALEAKQREEQKAIEDQQKAEEKQRLLRSSFDAALSLSSQEGIKIPEKRRLFKDIIAIVNKGSLFEDLKGKNRTDVNAKVEDLISSGGDISGLPSVKKFRAAQALSTPAVAEAPAPSVAPEIAPAPAVAPAVEQAPVEDIVQPDIPIDTEIPDRYAGVVIEEDVDPVKDLVVRVPRPKNWNKMSAQGKIDWAKESYPLVDDSDIKRYIDLVDRPVTPFDPEIADYRIARRNVERMLAATPEEGMAKLKGKKKVQAPTQVSPYDTLFNQIMDRQKASMASVEPERGTLVERMPKRQEVPLNLDVDAARAVSQKAYQQLKDLNVSDIYSTVVVDRFLDEKGNPKPDAARFLNNVIKLASKDGDTTITEDNIIKTINHEVVHGMKESGFFTDAEWKLLTNKFTPISEMDDETVAAYTKRYTDQGDSPEVVQEKLQEEAVAAAIERLSDMPAKSLDIPSVSLLSKVKSLARLGTAANNLGYTAEDLISAVRAGDVGKRAIKGSPTMLDAIRQGRIPAEARVSPTPSRAQAEGVRVQPAEELTPEEVDLVDDATIPEELRGTTPSQLPEESKGTKEQADASMYKLTKQNQPKLHKVNEKKGVLDLLLSEDSIKKPGETLKELGSKARRSELAKDLSGDESGLGSIRLGLRQRTLDSAAAILKQAENLFRKDGNPVWVETATSAITAVRDSYKSNELLSQALNVGYIYLDRKTGFFMVKADKNYAMMPAMKKLSSKGKLYQGWDAAIAQRFVDIENSGRDAKKMLGGDFTLKEAQDTVNSYRNDADIQEFLKVYKNFNDSLIDLNRYVGNFDPKLAATLKSWYYSPYYRVPLDEDGNLEAPNVGSSRLTNLASLKKISGRERAINDMIENFIVNAQYMAGYAMKNEAAIRTIRDSVAANNAKRIASPSDAVQKDRVVRINDRGQKAYYEIEDPLLYQAMNSSQVRLGSMVNLGRGFAQALRSGVTSAPTFMFNNMFLDSFRLYYMGIYQDNFVKSIVGNIAQGIGSVYKGMRFGTDPVYDKLLNAGLITNNFASRDAVQSAKEIKRQLAVEQGSAIANFFRTFKNYTLGKLETASRASEAVNRVQVYKNVYKNLRKEGATDAEAESSALFAAMQYPVNFDIRGSGRIVQYATALIPFVNASAQGTDVFYTNVKEVWKTKAKGLKPINKLQASSLEAAKRTMLSSFGLATLYAFGMALSDDEEYKALPLSERFRTLLIPIPGSAATVKIPVPPEIGAVTLMLPVAAAEAIMGMDNGPQIAKAMFAYFTNLFTFSPIPQVVKPALEVAVNRDLYSGRPIENQAMRRILPQYRYEESSSGLSKGIADVAASMKLPISPIQFDHLIRGYFGTLGMYLSDVSGQLYDPQNKDIDRLKLSDPYLLPFIGKKFASPVDRKAMDDYYEIRNAATQAANTLKMIEASKVYEENPGKLREMAYMAKVNEAMEAGPEKEMEELRKLKAQVLSAPRDHINPSQKTEIIKQINLRMNEVARGVQPLKRYIPFTLF